MEIPPVVYIGEEPYLTQFNGVEYDNWIFKDALGNDRYIRSAAEIKAGQKGLTAADAIDIIYRTLKKKLDGDLLLLLGQLDATWTFSNGWAKRSQVGGLNITIPKRVRLRAINNTVIELQGNDTDDHGMYVSAHFPPPDVEVLLRQSQRVTRALIHLDTGQFEF